MISGAITTLALIWFVVAVVLGGATYMEVRRTGKRMDKFQTFMQAAAWPKYIQSAIRWWVDTSLQDKGG